MGITDPTTVLDNGTVSAGIESAPEQQTSTVDHKLLPLTTHEIILYRAEIVSADSLEEINKSLQAMFGNEQSRKEKLSAKVDPISNAIELVTDGTSVASKNVEPTIETSASTIAPIRNEDMTIAIEPQQTKSTMSNTSAEPAVEAIVHDDRDEQINLTDAERSEADAQARINNSSKSAEEIMEKVQTASDKQFAKVA